ncbi:ECF RNA polymerase sigma factor SigW [Streptosporangium roseum]|uniref:RNA polymerase, sigma-24 subunit, ECF subfamily n=1 Tax=Streptosporangium roseum (strain ATCC 12428 / DSM 43021 / JCM 3005 / KCTC 9067 / NCIMB 10171 / NRRL 2505 / NI 9100) TaxID=479432 RepID=D2B2U1_STRRD|nr:RNA polymerase, sigma-24 subunit, ECF subfamily [Streptosporangium roseum DSM 43021]
MPDTWPFAGPLPTVSGVAQPVRRNELAVREDASEDLRRLVLRAKTGDADAFGTLYDRYLDLVYRYIYFRVGSHPLAEDLTSETFLRALRRIADFTWQGRDFGAWLVTIARNLITDHFKSGRYRLEVSTAEVIDIPLDGPHIPENAVVTAMINDRVLSAVRDLGPEQQECVVLRFLHGMSLAETALIMGKKSGAIKALQFRAIRALARALPSDLS